eukprot:CAMPEP_0180771616 /NCGR_PEP_ID=MMETSP1038_2-20121128/42267_1 /TAXON_ID=632150 /ORGANISM="Azadinium spinosum, Strain 3D9" /LENGTH=42 /DNA_ID= /DNA_START= /DNA_END= /DNA_ORIENTATION=
MTSNMELAKAVSQGICMLISTTFWLSLFAAASRSRQHMAPMA